MSNEKDQMPTDTKTQGKIRWLPLESNPEVMNKIIHENGVDQTWEYTDVYGFDPELLAMVPTPAVAIIFLFPIPDAYENYRKAEDARIGENYVARSNVYLFKQTIGNACGMMAVLHSLANNANIVGPGVFQRIIDNTKTLSPEARGKYLEGCAELASVHERGAQDGQTTPPSLDAVVDRHFSCFVKIDDNLYELDGRRPFPVNHGTCSDLIEDSARVMKKYIKVITDADPKEAHFTAIALAKKQ